MPSLSEMLAQKQAKDKAVKEAAEAEANRKAAIFITPEKPISIPDATIEMKPVKPRAPRQPREPKAEPKFDVGKDLLPVFSKMIDEKLAVFMETITSELGKVKVADNGEGIKNDLQVVKGDILKAIQGLNQGTGTGDQHVDVLSGTRTLTTGTLRDFVEAFIMPRCRTGRQKALELLKEKFKNQVLFLALRVDESLQ